MSGEPALSLPAQLYLLSWDTTKDRSTGTPYLAHLVRAAALTELAQRGLLLDRDGVATPASPDAETGDPALDGLLELVVESRPRKWKSWVTSRSKVTLDAVVAQLTKDGLLHDRSRRLLGIIPSHQYELADRGIADGLRKRARAVLLGDTPTAEVSDRDAAVIALATAGELRTVASGKERRQYRDRIAALAERGGDAAPALRRVIQDVRAAVAIAAATAASSAAANS
ncbi:GPP34 family phosphoprotein [Streptomyces sp. NPDC050560]|uniref:GOLPH3/VPS74 family protein n=1 Tax=Streptomyces sp. NPDC050560 TaxID=3365630 RepID=UPI00379FBFB2